MSNRINALITAGFLTGILIILMIADLAMAKITPVAGDNSQSVPKPQLKLQTVLDGSFMKEYETYLSEQFVAKESWAELKTRVDILMQKKEINGVYLCKDDYVIECIKPEDVDRTVLEKRLKLLEDFVEQYDARVMLVPTADNILTDKLPGWAQYYDQQVLLEEVRARIGEAYLIDVMSRLKEHAEEEIYYRTARRWTMLGAYYGYQEWKQATGSVAYRRWQKEDLDNGELQEYTPKEGQPIQQIETGYRGRKDLVLIKNSFADGMIPFLTVHYSNIYVVDLQNDSGSLEKLIGSYVDGGAEVLLLYDCIGFIESFQYQ